MTVAKYYTASGRCIQRLDYGGKREEDGSARAFSDSTRQVFYTRNGRPVTVEPAFNRMSKSMCLHELRARRLYLNGILFDFAMRSAERDSIGPAAEFALQDADWEAFVDFALNMSRRRSSRARWMLLNS